MPTLNVLVKGETHAIAFEPGPSVRDILDATHFRVRSACHGNGACGLCRVRVLLGDGGPLTDNERIHLHRSLLERGERLACQMRPSQDLTVEVANPAPPSNWRATPEGLWRRGEVREHDANPPSTTHEHPCGMAVDIGTTNICLSLFDLERGRWLADRWGRNPQSVHGADVLSRLSAAAASPEAAQEMANSVVEAMAEALQDIAVRNGFDLRRVVYVALVGNTAMLTLLTGENHAALLRPENWTEPIESHLPKEAAKWIARWQISTDAQIDLIAPLAGFIGSDLLAGLIATRLTEGAAPALFIDVGTNSEVALWDGRVLGVTSAAGGPAFEQAASLGMPAEPGAVYRVERVGNRLEAHILGDGKPEGICGSGLVDLIARLQEMGALDEKGRFIGGGDFVLSAGDEELVLTKGDVDAFQRAKAAIGVAAATLCAEAGIPFAGLHRICVAGAFGRYLDIGSAQAVGLLPRVPPERIELVGNTALAGCADLLLSSLASERLERLRSLDIRIINLACHPGFDDRFIDNLYLRPLA
jgi:uncharacterized 2Fe-2S/4Fe-4S cluster protein (DUF4445 family)